jgi:hypothetical protein
MSFSVSWNSSSSFLDSFFAIPASSFGYVENVRPVDWFLLGGSQPDRASNVPVH